MSELRVFKFGGTSVGGAERLAQVLRIVAHERTLSPLAVVVSAPGDTTDWLLEAGECAAAGDSARADALVDRIASVASNAVEGALAAHGHAWPDATNVITATLADLRRLLGGIAVVGAFSGAIRDHALSFGERLSSRLVAGALTTLGVAATPVDARTWTVTDDTFGAARVDWDATLARITTLASTWSPGVVTVHTGFLGATPKGVTTTLGRNGSDFTAALLGRALGAREVDIYTDVPGVMTADPSIEREAYAVPHLSYREALELAGLGLRMFHPRTMVPLLESNVPMRIRSTMRPDEPGTLVDAVGSSDARRPTCVCSLEDVALLDVEGSQRTEGAGLGPRALSALEAAGVAVLFSTLAPYGNGVALAVSRVDLARAEHHLGEALAREIQRGDVAAPRVFAPATVLTLVAEAMGRTVGVAARFYGALGSIGVNVRASAQGASSRAICAVIDAADTAVAVRAVHAAFNLAREQVDVLLVGKGTVGGHVLAQVAAEREKLARDCDLDLRVVGVADSGGALFDEHGLDPARVREQLDAKSLPRVSLVAALDRLAKLPVPVLIDCSAADGMEALYVQALERGIHVVGANKKPLVLPRAERAKIFEAARRAHRAWRYETTCGAGLPVIETLKNLVRTGDRVTLVEGSLSGTLGFLSNEVTRGVSLSRAVRAARERGYTEPHPRDDLTGLDAGRKALILARELGLDAELDDVVVEPFVPSELLAADDLDEFFRALEGHDEAFAARIAALRAEGRALRYLAQIEPGTGDRRPKIRVGPVGVASDHPATRLRGSEAFVAFTTERYAEYPLVVQGAGAGGAVTAAGVLADVLALCQSLRGR
jgi:bifunctional aspartokinase / homoserine dehydrogenase 1